MIKQKLGCIFIFDRCAQEAPLFSCFHLLPPTKAGTHFQARAQLLCHPLPEHPGVIARGDHELIIVQDSQLCCSLNLCDRTKTSNRLMKKDSTSEKIVNAYQLVKVVICNTLCLRALAAATCTIRLTLSDLHTWVIKLFGVWKWLWGGGGE